MTPLTCKYVAPTPSLELEWVRVPAHAQLRGHGHEDVHLCAVLDGAFEERGRRARWAAAGTLRFSPAGDEHDLAFGPRGAECLVVLLRGVLTTNAALPDARRFVTTPTAVEAARALRSQVSRGAASPIDMELTALELLACAARDTTSRASGRPSWLTRVRARMADQPLTPPSTLELAAETGLHPVYVARAFRRWYGCSLGGYARALRLRHAHAQLCAGVTPARVAAESGFADQSHLTRELRRRLGLTPGLLRRAYEVARVQDLPIAGD